MPATYSDGKTRAKVGDYVHGVTPNGAPIAGNVASVDNTNNKVVVVPQVQDATLCNAADHTPVAGAAKS